MSNILSEVHPELVAEWSDKNLPLTPDRITYGSNKVVWWKGACGHEWQTSVKARSNGENCPICSGARVIEGVNDLATLKPELADEWSSKNDPLKPTMVTTGSHKKVIWRDKYGHEWTATVKSRALNGTGCPYCSHNKILVGFNDLASQHPQIASEWSERNYPLKPDMVTVFANRKVWWRCSKGHEWNTLISTRSGGSGCPYCSGQLLLKGFNDFATTHPQLAQEWSDRNLPLAPDMINEKSRRNVWWKCRECGYTPKTPAGKRKVPMLSFVKEAIIMEKERQELLDLHCTATIDGYTDFIFINRFGNPQHQGTLNKAIRRIIRDCNDEQFLKNEKPEVLLPHFSCHSLRHTFTTRMCEAGVNVKVIQDTLGHKDISTTLNIYTDVTKELRQSEFEGLDSYFKSEYNKVSDE